MLDDLLVGMLLYLVGYRAIQRTSVVIIIIIMRCQVVWQSSMVAIRLEGYAIRLLYGKVAGYTTPERSYR